jgi:phage I-like protein
MGQAQILIVGTGEIKRTLNAVALALNSEKEEVLEGSLADIALNFEIPEEGPLPEWVELIPAGKVVVGRDGRSWVNDDPQKLLDEFKANKAPLPIDIEHATQKKAPYGDAAPAMGWIEELEIRDGAIWGRVVWTSYGMHLVKSREYRFLSPVFVFEKESLRIIRLVSAGLTNKHNLQLQALNNEQNKEDKMDLVKLLAALGLPATTTFDEAMNHIKELNTNLATALNQAKTPSLDLFVPRADYDKAVERATNAEGEVQKQKNTELETAINTEVNAALKAGKITPGTKDYYIAQCKQAGGLDSFKDFVKAAPVIADASNLDGKKPDGGDEALNTETQTVAGLMGNSAEDIKKYGT